MRMFGDVAFMRLQESRRLEMLAGEFEHPNGHKIVTRVQSKT